MIKPSSYQMHTSQSGLFFCVCTVSLLNSIYLFFKSYLSFHFTHSMSISDSLPSDSSPSTLKIVIFQLAQRSVSRSGAACEQQARSKCQHSCCCIKFLDFLKAIRQNLPISSNSQITKLSRSIHLKRENSHIHPSKAKALQCILSLLCVL